ncbi:Fe-S cluster assembly factor 101, chloroplastic, partial [Cucurbita argyrosperma subsp. sororia]
MPLIQYHQRSIQTRTKEWKCRFPWYVEGPFRVQSLEMLLLLKVSFRLELTTPACPVKDMFEQRANEKISKIVAVSSCKGGVGKSIVAVNLAYTLAGMGARVGQGRAIMRGPMVSGVISQLLTTTEWGELDYLVIDMPPGTGDIQLTLCQVVPLTAAIIVTTPQKLAFIDVAKGVRMFSKLKVPCVAVVENMCHFDADGKRYYPFGRGSAFQDLGVCVVQQCAKIRQQVSTAVTYDRTIQAIRVKVPDSDEEFLLHPATVRRNDRSAQSVDEWTGEQKLQYGDIPEDIQPEEIKPMGNYALTITWPDGFNQVAPYDQLQMMERLVDVPQLTPAQAA